MLVLAKEIENDLSKENVRVKGFKSDASNFDDCQRLVDQITKEFNTIDILINNAGITRDNLLMQNHKATTHIHNMGYFQKQD